MRNLWILIVLFAFFEAFLQAQDYPRAEIYGGYQLLLDDDFFLGDSGAHLNGFAVGGEFNIKRFFGIAGELGYGKSKFNIRNENFHRSQTIVMAGPRFSHRARKIRIFGNVLIGISHEASDNTVPPPPKVSTNNFAIILGGGMDFPIGERISIRPVQLEAISTRHERAAGREHRLTQLRYLGGIVVKLGR